jgi:hypothetical protein
MRWVLVAPMADILQLFNHVSIPPLRWVVGFSTTKPPFINLILGKGEERENSFKYEFGN